MSFEWNLSSDDDDGSDVEVENCVDEISNKVTDDNGIKITDDGSVQKGDDDGESSASDGYDFDGKDVNNDDHGNYYDFNDDDDDDDDDYDYDNVDSTFATMAFPSDFDDPITTTTDFDDDDDDDDGEIDWEDAINEGEEENGPTTVALKSITIDMGNSNDDDDEGKKKKDHLQSKKRKRTMSRSVFRHSRLNDPKLKQLLTSLNKSSLLSWTCHANSVSRYVSDEESLGLAYSLIPTAWLRNNNDSESSVVVPTSDDVGHFIRWFANFVRSSSSTSSIGSSPTATLTDSTAVVPTGRRVKTNVSSSASSLYASRIRNNNNNHRRPRTTSSSPNKSKKKGSNRMYSKQEKLISTTTIHYRLSEYCFYLGRNYHQNVVIKDFYNEYDMVILYLAMVRSMGWRARYCVAVEPIPTDLDVNHPLFNSKNNENICIKFWRRCSAAISSSSSSLPILTTGDNKNTPILLDDDDDNDTKPPAVESTKTTISSLSSSKREGIAEPCHDYPSSLYNNNDNESTSVANKHVCWVEILCQSNTKTNNGTTVTKVGNKTPTMQWMHVDPILGIVNQPRTVERVLFAKKRDVPIEQVLIAATIGNGNSRGKNNRSPISYALAVEHILAGKVKKGHRRQDTTTIDDDNNENDNLVVRMTDVTRRYASSMVDTMEARGIPQRRTKQGTKRRRRLSNNMRTRTAFNTMEQEEERPDEWWSEFLKTISYPSHNPSPPLKAKIQSKGRTFQDAITLKDEDEDDGKEEMNRKPAAVDLLSKNNVPIDNNNKIEDENENNHDTFDLERDEESQLAARKEPLPTSKAAFKKHPMYVIRSGLNSTEVLKPDSKKRVCGMFKGELVFQRSDVETALSEKRWFYEGRKVRESELDKPILKVKARKKPTSDQFKALKTYGVGDINDGSTESRAKQIQDASKSIGEDGRKHLYGSWQSDPWGPTPVSPNDPIPVNEYNNIELELLNPGLVHVELHHIAKVAKKLNLPYAPCLLGFESNGRGRGGGGGTRMPTIRGIVVHEHNEELLCEAHAEMSDFLLQQEHDSKKHSILLKWKRLLVGILTKDRLEREYGDDNNDGK
mmetsp:Transcript_6881/g.7863  ORF Transcript_6881/g.7863 Transcript_6881/m.7863 type:complete len:1072 (-) Transcript_6881:1276-4491(-)